MLHDDDVDVDGSPSVKVLALLPLALFVASKSRG